VHRPARVEIGKFDLEIGEINFAELAQLRAAARYTTEARCLKSGVKRVFVSLASIHGFEMLVESRDDQVWGRHE
jgi:hypothetical protein